ncbi:DUF3443 domain-containing protein [Paraburkholderia lacunae]|uniref:DUF3443 domain-containing protein n=1 Tax=Paraburkholderia lacunae TaxID=2211104 RepID=A0A370N1A8_9BURK|nr:DUF3443 domain-containing protein [Paraburkholderia lacunae]RDJ99388.1 hypothetical protein DLM46_28440 [Paraburkholderia lacunae]
MKTSSKTLWVAMVAVGVALSACGGGGDSNTSVKTPSVERPVTPNPPSPPIDNSNSNAVPIVINASMGSINMPTVSIVLCGPGQQDSSQCETVGHMLVDTGSVGVRVMASAVSPRLRSQLLLQTTSDSKQASESPLAQCAQFASGFTWGSVRRADVTIGNTKASNIPLELIGDGSYATPSDCMSNGGPDLSSAQALGANGIIGIGHGVRDYPDAAKTVLPANYYACASANSCVGTTVPVNRQVMNPVAAFATHNNGTVIRLPALPAGGQASVTGELVFGIGTQPNNMLPTDANVVAVDQHGYFTTRYQGRVFTTSAIDSGTNGFAFDDATIPTTGEGAYAWYAPSSALSLSATMQATSGAGTPIMVPFSIGNAQTLMANNYAAYDNIGAPVSRWFLWGLPFFYGRNVYTVLEGATVGTQTGPFVAF